MTTPALLRLRERLPNTRIVVLTPEKLKDLYAGHHAVDGVLSFAEGASVWRVARQIRQGGFDASLLFPNSFRVALEALLGGVPVRTGLAAQGRRLLLTHATKPRPQHVKMRKLSAGEVRRRIEQGAPNKESPASDAHQVHHYLHLAAKFFGCNPTPTAPVLRINRVEMDQVSARFGLEAGAPVLGINPGAQYGPAKRWPAESYIEAALSVHRRAPAQWLVFGATQDAPACHSIVDAINAKYPGAARNLAARTSLRELMALTSRCKVLLTNDSGPMHLAAALGTRVVAIFGSTSPELTGPFSLQSPFHSVLRAGVPCSPCFLRECPIDLRCLREITPEMAVQEILGSKGL